MGYFGELQGGELNADFGEDVKDVEALPKTVLSMDDIRAVGVTYIDRKGNTMYVTKDGYIKIKPKVGKTMIFTLQEVINTMSCSNENTILYLCDGNNPKCNKKSCFVHEKDGTCEYTSDIRYARNFALADEVKGKKFYTESSSSIPNC